MNPFSITDIAKQLVGSLLQPGDHAVDATTGNGQDTLALAQTVGSSGKVYGFDIQEEALIATRNMLTTRNTISQVELIQACHSKMAEHIIKPVHAVMFNLGYLPNGNKSVTTQATTTLSAIEQAQGLLVPGGIISVVTYPGHEEGAREHQALTNWLTENPNVQATHIKIENRSTSAPQLFLLPSLH